MSQSSILLSTLGCVIVWTISCWISRWTTSREYAQIAELHGCRPPLRLHNRSPWGIDRVKELCLADRESRLNQLLSFHFRRLGATIEHIFLSSRALGTIEPRNIEAMLGKNHEGKQAHWHTKVFAKRRRDWSIEPRRHAMLPLFGDGIFTQEDSKWRRSRELLRPQFKCHQYENLEIFRKAVDNLINAIPKQEVIDLQPLFLRLTLDLTTEFFFGVSVNSIMTPELAGEANFAHAFNVAQDCIARRVRWHGLHWFIGGKDFTKACKDVQSFADQIIDQHLARGAQHEGRSRRYVFLDLLAQQTPDRIEMRSQIINILLAGRDTTASTLSWVFFLLVRHQEVLTKLRAEIASQDHLSRNNFKRSSLRKLPYLHNVLRETLRLYPPIPVNSRTAVRTTILPVGGGADLQSPVLVPKGTDVAYSVYEMHRWPKLYGMDADIYRPERWDEPMPLNEDPVNAKWGYLPFNGGPRICLGMDFGLTEVAYTVMRLIESFPMIKLPPGEPVNLVGGEKQTLTVVLSSTDGCRVVVSP